MIVTLKAFCEQTGFPKQMIKTHAKSGLLPYIPCGRRYLFDKEETLKRLDLLKAVPIYTPKRANSERCRRITNKLPEEYSSRTERLKALIKQKKKTAAAATATVKAGNKKTADLNDSPAHIIP